MASSCINLPKPHTSPRTTTLRTGSPNFAGQTATQGQGESYYNYYLKWACDRASEGSPATETFYYAYFDGRAPPKAPDYEQYVVGRLVGQRLLPNKKSARLTAYPNACVFISTQVVRHRRPRRHA